MFRPLAFAAARAATFRIAPRIIAPSRFRAQVPVKMFTPLFSGVRSYSAAAVLEEDEIKGRILDLLKNFDKVGVLRISICVNGHRSKT
jgi:NADH dehydrogenase (ubiquinone) 1 alpha/beta subcomplex 1, acyl-carrier protein